MSAEVFVIDSNQKAGPSQGLKIREGACSTVVGKKNYQIFRLIKAIY